MNYSSWFVSSVVLILGLMQAQGTYAENNIRGSGSVLMEEVVVTAQKKTVAESVQDVPIAITAMTGESLEAWQIVTLDEIGSRVPNALMDPQTTVPGATAFQIRGMGTSSSIPSDDPAVGVFLDGAVLGILHGSNLDTFDLETVEILRGPQGTLFGRNVTGGAIVLRTVRPDFESHLDMKLGFGSHGQEEAAVRAMGTLVEDTLAGKLSIQYKNRDGFFKNEYTEPAPAPIFGRSLSPSKDYGKEESLVVRPAVRWTPSDALTIDFIGEFTKVEGDGTPWQALYSAFGGEPPADPTKLVVNHNGMVELDSAGLVIDANLETERGVWTSLTAYRQHETFLMFDTDGTGEQIFTFLINPDQEQFSQEIRWAGDIGDKTQLTLGAYYFNQDVDYLEGRWIFAGAVPQGLGGKLEHTSAALFGSLTWDVTDTLSVNAGLRYTAEEKDSQQIVGGNGCNPETGVCAYNFEGDDNWSNLSPSLSIQKYLSDDVMWYASYKRGFRSGGFNLRHTDVNASPVYDEETVDAYEIGMKGDFGDSFRINVSLWSNTYSDLQVTALNANAAQVTRNAAEARVTGLDTELTWRATDTLTFSANIGVMDGKFIDVDPDVLAVWNAGRTTTNFPPAGDSLPPYESASDFRMEYLPEVMAGVSAVWDIPLRSGAYVIVQGHWAYNGSQIAGPDNIWHKPSTSTFDGSISWVSADERWKATLWGKNLNDETYQLGFTNISLFTTTAYMPERNYGLSVEFSL